ncbi:MAG: hypothetical protein NT169_28210, partial [Chloroflexi bacterium]|nr:hypothetical protein [Chloroflexota bacterium]
MNLVWIDERCRTLAVLKQQGQHAAALSVIDEIEAFVPANIPLLSLRAQHLAELGRNDEAALCCEKARARVQEAREDCAAMSDLLSTEQVNGWRGILDALEQPIQALTDGLKPKAVPNESEQLQHVVES